MMIRLIDVVLVQFDAFVHTLLYDRNNMIFDNWENYVTGILNVLWSVRKLYLRASYHVYV